MVRAANSPKIGVIGVRGGWSSERLANAVAARVGHAPLVEIADVALDLSTGAVRTSDVDLGAYDALIVKKLGHSYAPELLDRLEILHFLYERGVRVFSRPASLMRLLDRLACTVMLRLAEIPMPRTIITEDLDLAAEAVGEMGRVVLKPLFTSKARGMEIVEHGPGVRERLAAFQASRNPVMYIQQMVPIPGRDLGVVFLGGEYLACYSREKADASWSTSTSKGGRYRPFSPSDSIIELARRAQAPFDLAFTCVDVVETAEGPLVFEVSAFGGFRGLLDANGIDAAALYADLVVSTLAAHAS